MISTLPQSDLTDYYNTTEVKTYPKNNIRLLKYSAPLSIKVITK